MASLIRFEFDKIISKKIVLAGLALMAAFNAAMYFGWGMPSISSRGENGETLYGSAAAARNQEIAARYGGTLTDDKVRQILRDFRQETGSYESVNSTYDWAAMLFAGTEGEESVRTVSQAYPEYEGEIRLGYTEGWGRFLFYMGNLMLMGGFVVVIAVAPVFSDEYTRGTDALILTSRYGKNKCAWAKTAAAFLFSSLFISLLIGMNLLLHLCTFGVAGWDAGVQADTLGVFTEVPYAMNFAQATAWSVALWIAAGLLLTGVTLLLSAVCRTSFVALVLSALFYAAPLGLNVTEELPAKLVSLLPIRMVQTYLVFWREELRLFGKTLLYALPAIAFVTITAAACQTAAGRVFGKHQVR